MKNVKYLINKTTVLVLSMLIVCCLHAIYPPSQLTSIVSNNNVTLNWEEPGIWFSHNESKVTEQGLTFGNAEMVFAHRYTPTDLNNHGVAGGMLTKVSFMSLFTANSFTVQVWTGGSANPYNPGSLVAEKVIGVGIVPEYRWYECTLDEPVPIPNSEELWIGYKVVTSSTLGACIEPNWTLDGQANMVSIDGVWSSYVSFPWPSNWMIKSFVTNSTIYDSSIHHDINDIPKIKSTYQIIASSHELYENDISKNYSPLLLGIVRNGDQNDNVQYLEKGKKYSINQTTNTDRNLLGFQVYRDDYLLTSEPINTYTFTANNVFAGAYTYKVVAVYAYGNSDPALLPVVVNRVTVFPYLEDFSYFPPNGWTRYRGLLSQNPSLIPYTGDWHFVFNWNIGNFMNTVSHPNKTCARINYFPDFLSVWLVSPEIYIYEASGYWLSFEMALTPWGGTSQGEGGIDDKLVILYSIYEDGVWSPWSSNNILAVWDNIGTEYSFNTIPSSGENFSIPLPIFETAGPTNDIRIKIAFYAESTIMNADIDLHLDNIEIFNENPYVYPSPEELNFTFTGDNALELSWLADDNNYLLKGYRVYRNDICLTPEPLNSPFYFDIDVPTGVYTYSVTNIFLGYIESAPTSIEITVGVYEKDITTQKAETRLLGNYPNPFNPVTSIRFYLSSQKEEVENKVIIDIYNIKGQKIRNLINGNFSTGYHIVNWNGLDDFSQAVSSGIYFYRLQSDNHTHVKRMLLIK